MSIIALAVFIVAAILIGGGITGWRQQNNPQTKGEAEQMVKHLYYYLVLFATLMMSIGGSVGVFMSAADYISPSSYYQSFEDFKTMKKEAGSNTTASEEELKQAYTEMIEMEKQRTKDNALNGIIKSFGWIIIPLPVFFYFQKQIRKKDTP